MQNTNKQQEIGQTRAPVFSIGLYIAVTEAKWV